MDDKLIEEIREILGAEAISSSTIKEAWNVACRGGGVAVAYFWDHIKAHGWTVAVTPYHLPGHCKHIKRTRKRWNTHGLQAIDMQEVNMRWTMSYSSFLSIGYPGPGVCVRTVGHDYKTLVVEPLPKRAKADHTGPWTIKKVIMGSARDSDVDLYLRRRYRISSLNSLEYRGMVDEDD